MGWFLLLLVVAGGGWLLREQGAIIKDQERDPRSPRYRGRR